MLKTAAELFVPELVVVLVSALLFLANASLPVAPTKTHGTHGSGTKDATWRTGKWWVRFLTPVVGDNEAVVKAKVKDKAKAYQEKKDKEARRQQKKDKRRQERTKDAEVKERRGSFDPLCVIGWAEFCFVCGFLVAGVNVAVSVWDIVRHAFAAARAAPAKVMLIFHTTYRIAGLVFTLLLYVVTAAPAILKSTLTCVSLVALVHTIRTVCYTAAAVYTILCRAIHVFVSTIDVCVLIIFLPVRGVIRFICCAPRTSLFVLVAYMSDVISLAEAAALRGNDDLSETPGLHDGRETNHTSTHVSTKSWVDDVPVWVWIVGAIALSAVLVIGVGVGGRRQGRGDMSTGAGLSAEDKKAMEAARGHATNKDTVQKEKNTRIRFAKWVKKKYPQSGVLKVESIKDGDLDYDWMIANGREAAEVVVAWLTVIKEKSGGKGFLTYAYVMNVFS